MPVKLSQTTWLQSHKRRCNRLAHGEIGRVNLVHLTASSANLLRRMLQRAVDEGTGLCNCWDIAGDIVRADGAVDNVRIGCRQGIEDRFIDAKVLREDRAGSVRDPVVDVESGA